MAPQTIRPGPPHPVGRAEEDRLDGLENAALSPAELRARDAVTMLACLLPMAGAGAVALLISGGVCL